MNQAIRTMNRIDRASQMVFWALVMGIVMLSSIYIFFINKTVRNVVARGQIQAEMASLNSKLSETEFDYINSVGAITLDSARELGFQPAVGSVTFVTRERIGKSVAIR